MKILFVDDQPNYRKMLKLFLERSGFEVSAVENGKEGLKALKKGDFDVIISDIMMPVMDGFEFCRIVKSNEKIKNIIFIFNTGSYIDKKDEDFARKLGADKFVTKPNAQKHLIKIINNLTREKAEGRVTIQDKSIQDEKEVYKLYNQRLVHKLEQNVIELEKEINDRKEAEELLRESEERFRSLFENSIVGFYRTTPDGQIVMANPAIIRMLGFASFKELSKRSLEEKGFEPSYPRDEFKKRLERDGKIVNLESVWMTRDKRQIHVSESAWVIKDGKGSVIYYDGTAEDVTEHKEAKEALKSARIFTDNLIETANVMIIGLDMKGNIKLFNPAAEKITGYSKAGLEGENWIEMLVPYKHYPSERERLKRLSYNRLPKKFESPILTKNGEERFISWNKNDIIEDDKRAGTILFGLDTTERRQAEENLKNTLSEVEKLKNQLQEENIYLREEINLEHNFTEIIGNSELLKKVLRNVEQAAPTDATVLILGETGTGKELFARAIHNLSKRKNRPLVKVNCAALPANLIESELFGHEKGAFTGAVDKRKGRFELADGGTLFLDEIGELPVETQVKLLRVLQEGEFERVGGDKTIKVDVRLITATNRELEKSIQQGKFREDLFYRINVLPISVPSLQDRKEDISLLAIHFARKYGNKLGKYFDKISRKTIEMLQALDWPGNIRELENVIERAVVFSQGPALQIDPVFLEGIGKKDEAEGFITLADMERKYILQVLEEKKWTISGKQGAALILGLKESTLRAKIKKLGIQRTDSSQQKN